MKWTDLLKAEVEASCRAAAGLMNLAEDAQLGWKPANGANWMTLGQLLMHCTNSCGMGCKGFVSGDWGPMPEGAGDAPMLPPAEKMPAVKSVAEAKKLLEEDRKVALAAIAQAGEERLEKERSVAPWGGPEYSLGQHLLSMAHHLNIHKAQLFYYLKLQGKPVNTMHMWGMM